MTSMELTRLLKDYELNFPNLYKHLINEMNFYSSEKGSKALKKSPKNEILDDFSLFKLWMEKYKEKHERDFYLKKSKRFLADEIRTSEQCIKDFSFFGINDWPHSFSCIFI